MNDTLLAALVALACGLGALGVPRLIAWIPEPEEPAEDKEPYAVIAARPGLTWKAVAASVVAGGLIGAQLGWSWPLVYLVPLVPIGVALAVIDWRTLLLPTKVIRPTFLLVVVGVLVCWLATREIDDLARAGLGFLVWGVIFYVMWWIYPPAMGFGDVRLSGVLGLALGQLGWGPLVVGLWLSFLLLGIVGGLLTVLRVLERKGNPFGPFMLVGALLGILWGDPLLTAFVER